MSALTFELFAPCNNRLFVANHIFEICAALNDGVLHENTVYYDCVLADLYAPEQNGIIHIALNVTAVGDNRSLN